MTIKFRLEYKYNYCHQVSVGGGSGEEHRADNELMNQQTHLKKSVDSTNISIFQT